MMQQQYPAYGYPQQQAPNSNYGWTYPNVSKAQAQNTQPLSQDMIDILSKKNFDDVLAMKYSEEDFWKSICTHKHKNGNSATVAETDKDGNQYFRCTICGAKITPKDYTMDDVQKAVDEVENILQMTKLIFLDVPVEFAREYFQFIMLLRNLPKLYNTATRNYAKYNQDSAQMMNQQRAFGNNLFQSLNIMSNGFYGSQGPWTVPQQPMMYQQYPNGMYGMPNNGVVDPNANPMMYSAPQPVPAAPAPMQAPPAGVVPAPAAPVVTTTAAPAPQQEEVQQTKQWNV